MDRGTEPGDRLPGPDASCERRGGFREDGGSGAAHPGNVQVMRCYIHC